MDLFFFLNAPFCKMGSQRYCNSSLINAASYTALLTHRCKRIAGALLCCESYWNNTAFPSQGPPGFTSCQFFSEMFHMKSAGKSLVSYCKEGEFVTALPVHSTAITQNVEHGVKSFLVHCSDMMKFKGITCDYGVRILWHPRRHKELVRVWTM